MEHKPYSWVFLFWLFLSLVSCIDIDTSPNKEDINQLPSSDYYKRTIETNKAPNIPEYYLQWGEIVIPLEKHFNSDRYKAWAEVSLEEFKEALDRELHLYKGEKALDIDFQSISKQSLFRLSERIYRYLPPSAYKIDEGHSLSEALGLALKKEAKRGDEWALRIAIPDEPISIYWATIRIHNPFEKYQPPKSLPPIRQDQEAYGFQLVNFNSGHSLLRIDTLNPKTAHILDLYKGQKKYKIGHMPEFSTKRRLVNESDQLFEKKEINKTELLSSKYDIWNLPEYHDFKPGQVSMDWGDLRADPSAETVSLSDFKKKATKSIQFFNLQHEMNMLEWDVSIIPEKGMAIRYVLNNIQDPIFQKALSELSGSASIYFEKVIVQSQDSVIFHYPFPFLFPVQGPLSYTLKMNDSDSLHKDQKLSVVDKKGMVQLNWKGVKLGELLGYFLNAEIGKIQLSDFEEEPIIDLYFFSEGVPLDNARDIILHELEKKYRLYYKWYPGEKVYALNLLNYDLVNAYKYSDQASEMRDFYWRQDPSNTQFNYYSGTFKELSIILGSEFNTHIVPDAMLPQGVYRFTLDCSSIEELQIQMLSDYGLELIESDKEIEWIVQRME